MRMLKSAFWYSDESLGQGREKIQKPKSTNMPYTNLVTYYVHVGRNDKHVKDKMRFNTVRR